MSNRIKDIFSDDMFSLDGKLSFRDKKSYQDFLSAMKIVQAEGRVVSVEGVTSIAASIKNQGIEYPLKEHTDIEHFQIGPSKEPVVIPVKVGDEETTVSLWRYQINSGVILESELNAIVYFRFQFFNNQGEHKVKYKVQFEHAKSVKDVVDSFSSAKALLDFFYEREDNYSETEGEVSLDALKEYFRYSEAFYRRLLAVEKELGISFPPKELEELSAENQHNIDELYLLLCKKQVVRLNAKLTATNSTAIKATQKSEEIKVGSKIKLTFLRNIEYVLFDQTISLYTANLLQNAVVKEIKEESDAVKILYGDTDSQPMYMTFTAFKTIDEAEKEMNEIIKHEEKYVSALTSSEYIKQLYSDK